MSKLFSILGTGLFLLAMADASLEDIRSRKIPDRTGAVLLLYGFSLCVLGGKPAGWGAGTVDVGERLLGLWVISLPMVVWNFCFPPAFGGGDVKLSAAGGFLIGWKAVLAGTAAGILLAGVYVCLLLLRGKTTGKGEVALGPFLCAGILIGFFRGEAISTWYAG